MVVRLGKRCQGFTVLAARSGLDTLAYRAGTLFPRGKLLGLFLVVGVLGGRPVAAPLEDWREPGRYPDTLDILECLASILTLFDVLIIVYTWVRVAIARW